MGIPVGITEGVVVVDGISVGIPVGIAEGVVVDDGIAVGIPVGITEGVVVVDGIAVGTLVGIVEGVVVADGIAVGIPVGIAEGVVVVDGIAVGTSVGIAEGVCGMRENEIKRKGELKNYMFIFTEGLRLIFPSSRGISFGYVASSRPSPIVTWHILQLRGIIKALTHCISPLRMNV